MQKTVCYTNVRRILKRGKMTESKVSDLDPRKKIRVIAFDVDGTLTDGKIYMSARGELFKAFNIKDGYALSHILPDNNIVPIIITARNSEIVSRRCAELGIKHCYQGCNNKEEKIHLIAKEFHIESNDKGKYEGIAYMGDDNIDIPPMKLCNIIGCPTDASDEVKEISNYISSKKGGEGAARDFIYWIVNC